MQKLIAQHPEHFSNENQLTPLLTKLSRFHHIQEYIVNSGWNLIIYP
jgi:hypothetical protein